HRARRGRRIGHHADLLAGPLRRACRGRGGVPDRRRLRPRRRHGDHSAGDLARRRNVYPGGGSDRRAGLFRLERVALPQGVEPAVAYAARGPRPAQSLSAFGEAASACGLDTAARLLTAGATPTAVNESIYELTRSVAIRFMRRDESGAAVSKSCSVLVVEDDPGVRELLRHVLTDEG